MSRRHRLFRLLAGALLLATARAEEPMPKLKLGINRPNLVWFAKGDVPTQNKLLSTIHEAGPTRVRLALQLPYARAVEHILHCNRIGMSVTIWICSGNPAFYPKGTARRKGIANPGAQFPLLFDQYRLADLDVALFRQALAKFLRECHKRNAKIEALQIFTEVNWADFNGDLPVVKGGWFLDGNTPWDDARYRVVRQGVQSCGEALRAAQSVTTEIYGPERIKILSPAMAGPPASWVRHASGSIIDAALYLQLLRGRHAKQQNAVDYLQYVDGIGVHIYPAIADTTEMGRATAKRQIQERMDPILKAAGTDHPYWVTEWGYPRYLFGKPPDEAKRLRQFHHFLGALKSYQPPGLSWGHVMLFNFDMMAQYDLYVDGRLLESAQSLRRTEY
ncbi:MAG: hypothetical protein HN849_02885 [Victivallales bacterium]|nr:hypothetical protein [Victivallales bacterium]